MKREHAVAVGIVVVCLCAIPAWANTTIPNNLAIDFRDSAWFGADAMHSFTVDNVTATALPDDTTLLYHDSVELNIDGLGIRGGEYDEVDREEQLLVEINGGRSLSGVWITDLYDPPDGTAEPEGEQGEVKINGRQMFFSTAAIPTRAMVNYGSISAEAYLSNPPCFRSQEIPLAMSFQSRVSRLCLLRELCFWQEWAQALSDGCADAGRFSVN